MGKGTDKMYESKWSGEFGGMQFGGIQSRKKPNEFKKLPFNYCSLSLQPFEHPKHGTNPVTGKKLDLKTLIKLNFYKNSDDEYYCPATYKVFNDHAHIVAIKTTGNVYSYEAIERLNIKPKYWKDLLTDEPFKRDDLITIQDPHNIESRDFTKFHYIKNNLKIKDEEKQDSLSNINVNATGSAARILKKISNDSSEKSKQDQKTTSSSTSTSTTPIKTSKKSIPYNAASYSRGLAAASFTSTAMTPITENENALIDEEEFMLGQIKSKGYARIVTNLGNLNIELFSDKSPRACYNFKKINYLINITFYISVIFHRKIKNFMIQGGDPTGTGKGGVSYWKKDFIDEFKSNLSHNERGLLSMANRGKNTNSSQFFFTFRPCTHLDNKHTIFGKLVGGKEVLDKMESVPTDESDRPLEEIKISEVTVFIDPYEEYKKDLEKKLKKDQEVKKLPVKTVKDNTTWFGTKLTSSRLSSSSTQDSSIPVGKYFKTQLSKKREFEEIEEGKKMKKNEMIISDTSKYGRKKVKPKSNNFGDFSNW
ncbi:3752_t:CDS:2 [Entrophospora sp. SA101]|nr:3752_t:CDS:2 [Entrophospora sp. SA101]